MKTNCLSHAVAAIVAVAVIALLGTAAVAFAAEPQLNIPRVTIVAKRMTAAEKAHFDRVERRANAARNRQTKAIVVARKAD